MNQIRKVSAGDALNIRARDWNALADIANGRVGSGRPGLNGNQSISVLVRNDTGGDLARYRCVTLDDPIYDLESDGSVDLIFKATAADSAKTPAILSEIIADGKFGRAWIYGLAYAWVGPGTTTIRNANPSSSSNRLAPTAGGSVRLLGAPSASVEKLLPVLLGAESLGLLMRTPSGGIAARSSTTISSASCTVWSRSGTTISATSQTESVYNLSTTAVGGTKYIIALPSNIGLVAGWEDC